MDEGKGEFEKRNIKEVVESKKNETMRKEELELEKMERRGRKRKDKGKRGI
jgi:hypothetical protein